MPTRQDTDLKALALTVRRRWRYYATAAAAEKPVRTYLRDLDDDTAAKIIARMQLVRRLGCKVGGARHLRGGIWEVRRTVGDTTHRILFSEEGKKGRILLALVGYTKKTQKTPDQIIDLALTRRKDWRDRARPARLTYR